MAIKDVKMFYLEDDIEKIQTKTNMYIRQYGTAGAFHLVREVVQNGIDECTDPNSNGRNILIRLDESDGSLYCEDDGRGFPEHDFPLDIFCTKIQSGSKFFRDQSGNTSGEFGLGLTAVNALSDQFSLQTFREDEEYTHLIEFESGKKLNDVRNKLTSSGKKHGSIVKFIPSKKYLGPTTRIMYSDMIDWIDGLSYQLPKKSKIKIVVERYDGLTLMDTVEFKARPFSEMIEKMVSTPLFNPIDIQGDASVVDETPNSTKKKSLHLDVVFTYDTPTALNTNRSTDEYDSYCNFTNTTDGGVHVTAVDEAICRFFANETKKTLTDKEKNKIDILWADVRSYLRVLINLSTNAQVQFEGNAKTKINSDSLIKPIKSIVTTELTKYFKGNDSLLSSITKLIKGNAKIRIAMSAEKVKLTGDKRTSFDDHGMRNLIQCNNRGKQYKEISLIEGLSASPANSRDPATQAFYMLFGVTANPFKVSSVKEIMENTELKGLVQALRCDIGTNFDITKLYYDKIIIMTDADIDGAYISAGACAFFVKFMPEIIEAGKLYKVYSPLYKIDDNKKSYVRTKEEYVDVYKHKIIKNYKIRCIEDKEFMGKVSMSQFILDTVDYSDELIRVSKHFGVNKYLIELIASYITLERYTSISELLSSQKNITKFMSAIQHTYPEIELKSGNSLRGICDGHYQSIKLEDRFITKCSELSDVYREYGLYLSISENGNSEHSMTIGQFLDETTKYVPKIITRYKGLGEISADDLRETTLDPNNRILVRLTFEDIDRDLQTFQKLFGQSKKNLEDRKKMMKSYKIKRDDLDN